MNASSTRLPPDEAVVEEVRRELRLALKDLQQVVDQTLERLDNLEGSPSDDRD